MKSVYKADFCGLLHILSGRRAYLMTGALISELNGPSASPGLGHYIVCFGKTLYSHSISLHPSLSVRTGEFNAGVSFAID